MNNAISIKALQETKVISDALQAQNIIGPDSVFEPTKQAAIAYGFRVKLKNPDIWVSVKKMYKEELGYSIRIYMLNRAIDGGRVLGEAKYTEQTGLMTATEAAIKVLEELQSFDQSFFDGVVMGYEDPEDDDEDFDEDDYETDLDDESEALSIEANQS